MNNNEANSKRLLQQREFQKLNDYYNNNTNVSISNKTSNPHLKNESQTLCNKLKTLNLNKKTQSLGKSLFRSTSETRQEPSTGEKEIKNLKNEISIFKNSPSNNGTWDNPKNAQMASTLRRHATDNTDLINVLTFIQQKMETLLVYNKQLKTKLRINLIHQETF